MQCQNCGAVNAVNYVFCIRCGTKRVIDLSRAATPTAPQAQAWASAPPTPAPSPGHNQRDQVSAPALLPAEFGAAGLVGKRRDLLSSWLIWPVLTLGVYGFVWWYKVNRELRDFCHPDSKPSHSVWAYFPGFLLLGIPPILSTYRGAERVRAAQCAADMPETCVPILTVILMFLWRLDALYLQYELNKIWEHYGTPPPGSRVSVAPRH